MVAVGMVQLAVHQVVDVVAVGHRLVAAVRAVGVVSLMPSVVAGGAALGVGGVDGEGVLLDPVRLAGLCSLHPDDSACLPTY